MENEQDMTMVKTKKAIDILVRDEWILFQIKEGPCAAACTYCYETPVVKKIIQDAQKKGVLDVVPVDPMDNAALAQFVSANRQRLNTEISLDEMRTYFGLLKGAGIQRAGLIGSEPTTHSQFRDILDAATATGIDLLVYTAGFAPRMLDHEAVKYVVLHLDYSRMNSDVVSKRLAEGSLPPTDYMETINELVTKGKKIDLRVNFTTAEMTEKALVFNFYEKLTPENRSKVLLKYSFTTRVTDQPDSDYSTPELLKKAGPTILQFVDEFKKRFPDAQMYAERPLFPCSFDPDVWAAYSNKGGFTSVCDMEFTVYPSTGLALCPPSRDLVKGVPITEPQQFTERLDELRTFMREIYKTPSFDVCKPCPKREDLSCQGGCLGYKLEIYNKKDTLLPTSGGTHGTDQRL